MKLAFIFTNQTRENTMTFEDYGIRGINPSSKEQQRTTCPKCSADRDKANDTCLSVNADKGVWFCWHCLWTGGLKEQDSHQFIIKEIKNYTVLPSKRLFEYFANRGIDSDIVNYNRLREDMIGFQKGMSKKWAIAFPYYLGDKLINIKYRSLDKDFLQSTGASFKTFYNLNDAMWQDSVIIVEGEIDVLSFQQAGLMNVISVPDGAPNADAKDLTQKFKFIDNSVEFLSGISKFYLACDKDPNGIKLKDELARRLGKARCSVVDFPTGCKDANDVLVKHGPERLRKCIDDASPYPIEGIFRVVDVAAEIRDIYDNGFPQGVKTGWSKLDELYSVHPGMLTVVTGVPNHGKLLCRNIVILTPDGWKTHGELRAGDRVFGRNGEIVKVLQVHPDDYADYEVTFSDGEVILVPHTARLYNSIKRFALTNQMFKHCFKSILPFA